MRAAIRPTSAAAASCSARADPSWLSVGFGGGGGTARAGAAEPSSVAPVRTATRTVRTERAGRPATGRRARRRAETVGVAGPDGRRWDIAALPGEEGARGGASAELHHHRES